MKLGEVIVAYNSDDASMQTFTVITLLKLDIHVFSNKNREYALMKPSILLVLLHHCNTTMGGEREEVEGYTSIKIMKIEVGCIRRMTPCQKL